MAPSKITKKIWLHSKNVIGSVMAILVPFVQDEFCFFRGKYNTCKTFMSMFFRHWKDSKYPQAMFTKKNMMRHTYPCKTTSHMKNALFVPEQKADFEFIFL